MSDWHQQQAAYQPYRTEDIPGLKLAYAAALLRHPDNPGAAAREVEPTGHQGRAGWILNEWTHDPDVLAEVAKRKLALGPAGSLPSKDDLALVLWTDAKALTTDPATKLAYLNKFAEVMGYIQKGGNTLVNNGVINHQPKIMKVPHFKTDEQWESAAITHNRQLTIDH